jgi:predicted ABC-type sugar transport system permease subunit
MDDPERVIAEALRAQAARTPLPSAEATQMNAAPGFGLAGTGYGLLSGSDLALSLQTMPGESGTVAAETHRVEPERRVSVPAILLLAIVLGLAAGAVVGLVTLL